MAIKVGEVLKTLGSLRWTEWVAYGTVALALHSAYKLVRIALSDADLQVWAQSTNQFVNPRSIFLGGIIHLNSHKFIISSL
jgi:hypothetical protein